MLPADKTANDQRVCWEKATDSNELFRITYPFTSGIYARQLLALHALFSSLDQLSNEIIDESVARRKLDWWRMETRNENVSKSRHPVVRFLHQTGAAAMLPVLAVKALMDSAETRLDAKAPACDEEFAALCSLVYRPRIELEGALEPKNIIPSSQQEALARNGALIQLMRDSYKVKHDTARAFWWIPLNVLARRGVSRSELAEKADSPATEEVFRDVFEMVIRLNSEAQDDTSKDILGFSSHLHLLLTSRLYLRQLKRLSKKSPSTYESELKRFYFRDVLSLWRAARKSTTRSHSV